MSNKPGEGTVREGSSNVFADLGLPDSEGLLAKAHLASAISDIIKGRHLTQTEAASVLGTTQPKVSSLVRGRLDGFSLERLALFLNSLDRDVEIRVRRRPRSRQTSRIRVTVG